MATAVMAGTSCFSPCLSMQGAAGPTAAGPTATHSVRNGRATSGVAPSSASKFAGQALVPQHLSSRSRRVHSSKTASDFSMRITTTAAGSSSSSSSVSPHANLKGTSKKIASALAALALSAALQLAPALSGPAMASEYSVLDAQPPASYYVDDANVLNRVTKRDLTTGLSELEKDTGYHINVVTLRKLTSKPDAFEFSDQLLEKWYPTVEEGTNKAVLLLITTQKEGAVSGGPSFVTAVGDQILDSVSTENLPVFAAEEKYNEAITSSIRRLEASIRNLPDPGPPETADTKRVSNFKSKEETSSKRGQFSTAVGGLLVIAFVVPMIQYYAYTTKR